MAETVFILNGDQIRLSDEEVIQAAQGLPPDPIQTWSVIVDGRAYPVKQVFRAALGRTDFTSHRAADVLRRLGFQVSDSGEHLMSSTEESRGDEEDERVADETRRVALNAAISYANSRPHLDLAGVLAAAEAFYTWLRISGGAR
jgi:hypothetical protein